MIEVGIFILISILLVAFTLTRPHRHRFPRLLALESLSALVLLNARRWFENPFSFRQVLSWILLASSLALAIHGFRLIRAAGAPAGDIENTTRLVTVGAYRFIRHPLYCTFLLCGVGTILKGVSALGFGLLLTLFIAVFITAKVEEQDNIKRFGEEYVAYKAGTWMFVPFVI
ncbi:MAG: isoprenylcysteine carboxylmethyltransferase family protein [Gemmatimonadota bacterium]|nr:MAG: isoprenylcysteine carboxylmethyltransferase family protein [Gemmatimonadota bacterium]